MANKKVMRILKRINVNNPDKEPPNKSFPKNNDSITMITVRYNAIHRKLMRGLRRRSINSLDPCDFSKLWIVRGDSRIRRATLPKKSGRR